MDTYDPHKMSLFLHEWFWPRNETYNLQFQEKFTWRSAINEKVDMTEEQPKTVSDGLSFVVIGVVALVLILVAMARKRTHAEGKTL